MAINLANVAKKLSETHPFVWALAWEAVFRMPFLLPHDRSYLALRHFIDRDSGLFLDVGANNGISALSFRRINGAYAILSLEPNILHKAKLDFVKRKDPLFDYRLIGAAPETGEVCFYTPVYYGVALHTFTSADPQQVRAAVEKSFGRRVANVIRLMECRAPVLPVDELDVSPSIIKVDAEGADLAVLGGAQATIDRCRPYMMIEAIHTGLMGFHEYFVPRNYTFLAYDVATSTFRRLGLDSGCGPAPSQNIFVVPDETIGRLPIT